MSVLNAFLHPEPINEEKDVVISTRFKDEKGNPVPFTIRTISQETNEELSKKAMRLVPGGKNREKKLDNILYTNSLVVACTVSPKFADAELCQAYGTMDPLEVPKKMLSAGEFTKLVAAIMELNNLGDDAEETEEEAKN